MAASRSYGLAIVAALNQVKEIEFDVGTMFVTADGARSSAAFERGGLAVGEGTSAFTVRRVGRGRVAMMCQKAGRRSYFELVRFVRYSFSFFSG
jgi:hypothetical protein